MHEYDLIAEWYASERVDQTGVAEAMALVRSLARGASVLDIGCGNGIPITRALLSAGYRIVGIDSSGEMLARFRDNCRGTPSVRGVVESCPFADAAVAWGVMFHLNQDEQLKAIESISRVLKKGAPFLFTSGDEDGNSDDFVGTMNGVTFHYYSFSSDNYRRVLDERGFRLVDVHADSGKNTYYLADKSE